MQVISGMPPYGPLLPVLYGGNLYDWFGVSMASLGDVDGDGHDDMVIGAIQNEAWGSPTVHTGPGYVRVYSGKIGALLHQVLGGSIPACFGISVAATGDVNGDGVPDYIVGAPLDSSQGGVQGSASVHSGKDGSKICELPDKDLLYFGNRVAGVGDVNHDSQPDFVVGAKQEGVGPGAVSCYAGPNGVWLWSVAGKSFNDYFGNRLESVEDLDGDGSDDVIAGSYQYDKGGVGYVRILSGESGALLFELRAIAPGGPFGESVADCGDCDGDGTHDILVGVSKSDVTGLDSGLAQVFSGRCLPPTAYGTAKVNSQGCTPAIDSWGQPDLSGSNPFFVKASQVINNKPGILFYGYAPESLVFQGGWLLVAAPIQRTPLQYSFGNPPPDDCSGTYSMDFNAWARSGVDPNLFVGQTAYAQYWYRDPKSLSTTGLTDAVRLTFCQ